MASFEELRLEKMVAVGAASESAVRFWIRVPSSGRRVFRLWPVARTQQVAERAVDLSFSRISDGTHGLQWPDDFDGVLPLDPGVHYGYAVADERAPYEQLGSGEFETSPRDVDATPSRFSIAVMSCHQPFENDGSVNQKALRQLEALEHAFEEHEVKRVIYLGDQMYADLPESRSLFEPGYFRTVAPPGKNTILECDASEVRSLYQKRYRTFWAFDAWQRLHGRYPGCLMMDDHELVDNFGSNPEHMTAKYRAVRSGALDAFFDYQGLRVRAWSAQRPASLHCTFEYGPIAAFVMDLRSQRTATEDRITIYDDSQLSALTSYLARQSHRPFMLLGLSVPLVQVPDWMANFAARFKGEGSDIDDRWSYEKARDSRDRLVQVLAEHQARHPRQRLILLGGDIHSGAASIVKWDRPTLRAWQLVSSPVTNVEGPLFRAAASLLARLGHVFEVGDDVTRCNLTLLDKQERHHRNPTVELNAGIIEVTRRDQWRFRLKLVGHDPSRRAKPRILFCSEWF